MSDHTQKKTSNTLRPPYDWPLGPSHPLILLLAHVVPAVPASLLFLLPLVGILGSLTLVDRLEDYYSGGLVQETNSASWEGGSCGGIPPVDGLSSLGEVSIPDPGVQRGRHFSWSPTVKVLLISSLQPSQAHLVLLASLILDLWGE